MDYITDPEVTKAPVHLVGLQIQNQENLDIHPGYSISDPMAKLTKDGDIDIQIFCSLFLDDDFINNNQNIPQYIYLTVLTDSEPQRYLAQQYGELPTDIGHFIGYSFHIKISASLINKYNIRKVRIIGSVITRTEPSTGISESLRAGRFLNTVLPVGGKD